MNTRADSTSMGLIWPGYEGPGKALLERLSYPQVPFEFRRFPDGESYLRITGQVEDRELIVICSLDRPDEKVLPLCWLSETARELGAKSVLLVAPYLAYLRQDARFKEGEAITSRYFARLISEHFDGLLTVDPHLHRYRSLEEIYKIPCRVVSAAPEISEWLRQHVSAPFLIGPDGESEQWVSQVAQASGACYSIAKKTRHGDRQVEIDFPETRSWQDYTPVILDDILSTGTTMIEMVRQLRQKGSAPPCCVAVHGIFADNAHANLVAAGAGDILTCNTIVHPTNRIDLSEHLAQALKGFS